VFRRNETKNKTVLRTASRRNETKKQTVLRTALLEGTRQRNRRSCAHLQKIDTEKDTACGSLQTLTTGSDFLLGNTWELDQEQDACLPAYRPLENKTERQTVSSARREQGPRALLTKRSPSREQGREINGLIDRLGTRTPSAAHQTIESAAESEIGPRSWELTVYPCSYTRRWLGVTRSAQARM
jgi:hypothetical protein